MNHFPSRRMPVLAGITLVVLLAGCSDGGADAVVDDERARPAVAVPVSATLLDDAGLPFPAQPDAVPADPGAHTRSGLYATPTQAAQLEGALGVGVVRVNVEPGPDAAAAVEQAVGIVFAVQAVYDLALDAPVLVRSPDLRLASAAVHQLESAGFTKAFLVNH